MRSIVLLILLIFLVSLFTACNPTALQHIEPSNSSEYFIESGQSCGWCGGTNIFNISSNQASFSHNYACDEFEDIPVKKINITNSEWSKLISKLDFDAFQKIDLQTCFMCSDGCDTKITITRSGSSHSFTYAWLEAEELDTVREFLTAFELLKTEKTKEFYP